jgi:hypothetical protein
MIPLPLRPQARRPAAAFPPGPGHRPARAFAAAGPTDSLRAAAAPGTGREVTISPSRAELRRAEPSLSFQVAAPGAQGFDVIVATDPALFDPANAHMRTPRNFRSSRQDFLGAPIEIETGFYLLPRAFLRELVSVTPRPTRLYYVAVAHDGPAGTQPRYSVPPEAMAGSAPHVVIAADLVAADLSRVLGAAVERIGTVAAGGRVLAARRDPASVPEVIGGLPVMRRMAPQSAPKAGTQPSAPAASGNGGAAGAANATANGWINRSPNPAGAGPANGTAARPAAPEAAPPATSMPAFVPASPPDPGGSFVDEDYAWADAAGSTDTAASTPGFRDLDAAAPAGGFAYDDGFGPLAAAAEAPAPIPPLDPLPEPAASPSPSPAASAPALRPAEPDMAEGDAADRLVAQAIAEGAAGRYDALSLDGGFRGRFGPADPYHKRAHDGLRLGPHQAAQDSGELGELLALMQSADPAGFARIFGAEAEALLATVTAEGPSSLDAPSGRGPRVQPVAGADLWEEPWVERFRAAARHAPFQAAMRAQIAVRRLDPLRPVAEALGIDRPRGLAMLLALALQRGVDWAVAHVRAAANPFDTPARVGAAVDALGHPDLVAFRAAQGLPPGDQLDAETHFALFAALRGLGPDSPVQVPDPEAVMDALVTAAGPGTLGDALLRLRVSPAFGTPGEE